MQPLHVDQLSNACHSVLVEVTELRLYATYIFSRHLCVLNYDMFGALATFLIYFIFFLILTEIT